MRPAWRLAIAVALAIIPFAGPVSGAPGGVRLITFIRAESEADFTGSLDVVRSDGKNHERLVPKRMQLADLGPGGTVWGIRRTPGRNGLGELVRTDVESGDSELIGPATKKRFYYGLAAGRQGQASFTRFVSRRVQPPAFLGGTVSQLYEADVPVLVPVEEPQASVDLFPVADVFHGGYSLRLTNDPNDELSHAEQVNFYVTGSTELPEGEPGGISSPAHVRGTTGTFACGASACFLAWEELGYQYTVAEFGSKGAAVDFAESLVPLDELLGPFGPEGGEVQEPHLTVREENGEERTLERVKGFCECGFQPVDFDAGGRHVLVIVGTEGYTELKEYPTDGPGRARTIKQGRRASFADAGYGPDGILVLAVGEGGPPGDLRQAGPGKRRLGEVVQRDVRAFDVQGSTLAYVTSEGDVVVRDLDSGNERTVGHRGIEVSVSPNVLPVEAAPISGPSGGGFPLIPVVLGSAGVLLVAGGITLWRVLRARSAAP